MDKNNTKSFKYKNFEVPIEDEMILLSNTNKLLLAVGISSKKILSTDELSRVASSLFVAIFESLFHEKIQGVIRVPKSRDDYEKNAQLVIDSLSDQIQLDLKHITGRSIVSGDIRVLSNLVHILIRIVSLTSQESLTTYDSSYMGEKLPQQFLIDHFGRNEDFSNDSISTRDSALFHERPYLHHNSSSSHNNIFPGYMQNSFNLLSNRRNEKFITLSEEMKNSIAKAQAYLKLEKKLETARRRRDNINYLKESRSRAINLKHQEVVKEISQKKWLEDCNREKKSFYLKKSNEEQVILRKTYRGLLHEIIKWRIEEQREVKQQTQQIKEQNNYQIQSIEHLFQERLKTLANYDAEVINNKDNNITKNTNKYEVLSIAYSVLKSLTMKYDNLMKKELNHIEQNKARELLKRRESYKNLLSLLSLEDWTTMLRSYNNSNHYDDNIFTYQ